MLGILKSDARFGTGTSFARAMSIFFKLGHLPKTIHHFAVEKASNSLSKNIVLSNPLATALNL